MMKLKTQAMADVALQLIALRAAISNLKELQTSDAP